VNKIDKENLIELLNVIFEAFEIEKLTYFKVIGKDNKTGYNKYEIKYITKDYLNIEYTTKITDYKRRE